jgi:hypothetical protein
MTMINSIGLRHQCVVEVLESIDNAIYAMNRAKSHLSVIKCTAEARQLHAIKGMLSSYRNVIAQKLLALRLEIDGERKP